MSNNKLKGACRALKSTLNFSLIFVVEIGLCLAFSLSSSANEFCLKLPLPASHVVSNLTDRSAVIALGRELVSSADKDLRRLGWKPINGFGPEEFWDQDGPRNDLKRYNPKLVYENDFRSLLQKLGVNDPTHYFENLLRERRQHSEGTNVLDMFGSGFFIEDQSLANSIIGMRFGSYKRSEIPPSYQGQVPQEILGDILNDRTWQLLDHYMETRSIETLDIGTVRPQGGWMKAFFSQTPELNALAIKMIIGQFLIRISPTGHLYLKTPIPYLRGNLAEHPELQQLARQIEMQTPFRLVLNAHLDIKTTYSLEAALIPK